MTWKPGESGNPYGRPKKGQTLTELMKQDLEQVVEIKHEDGTSEQIPQKILFVRSVILKALGGDSASAKLIMEYVDGKPITKILEGKLDIVESEEWEELITGLWGIAEEIPELKQKVYELLTRLDTTGRSSSLCETGTGEDAGAVEGAGQPAGDSPAVECETDSVSVSPTVGKVECNSIQGPAQSEVLQETVDTDSVADGETEQGIVSKDI